MTRTEIQRRELSENERHNQQMERLKKIDSVFNAVGSVASAYGAAGSLVKGLSSVKKPGVTPNVGKAIGDTFVKSKHIHYHKK